MPIKALKAHYYYQSGDTLTAIKILKNPPKNDNPFLGVYEGKLGQIYYDLEMIDSSYKYSRLAYNKLSKNLLHAGYLMNSLVELQYEDEMNEVLVEAGSVLNGALLKESLIDEIVLYLAPCFLGDKAKGMFDLPILNEMSEKYDFKINDVSQIGPDIKVILRK